MKGRFVKGNFPWHKGTKGKIKNGFKEGHIPWNKGKTCLNDRRVLSLRTWLGKKRPETSTKLSGKNNPMFGKHPTEMAIKKNSEAHSKEKHWNWQGGKSFEPYTFEFNKNLKRKIRERDGNKCQSPGSCKGVLTIHHIDYNKKNNDLNNFITLCTRHNTMANKNKEYWQRLYYSITSKKLAQIV